MHGICFMHICFMQSFTNNILVCIIHFFIKIFREFSLWGGGGGGGGLGREASPALSPLDKTLAVVLGSALSQTYITSDSPACSSVIFHGCSFYSKVSRKDIRLPAWIFQIMLCETGNC